MALTNDNNDYLKIVRIEYDYLNSTGRITYSINDNDYRVYVDKQIINDTFSIIPDGSLDVRDAMLKSGYNALTRDMFYEWTQC